MMGLFEAAGRDRGIRPGSRARLGPWPLTGLDALRELLSDFRALLQAFWVALFLRKNEEFLYSLEIC